MPFPRARARTTRTGICSLVLASTALGPLLVPSVASAAATPTVTGSLRTAVVNDAVVDATFTFRNTGTVSAPVTAAFDLARGMVHNRLSARVSVTMTGTRVTVTAPGTLEPGASLEVPLYLLDGSGAVPEHCSVGTAPVDGCSAPEAGAPAPSPSPSPSPGDDTDGEQTGQGSDGGAEAGSEADQGGDTPAPSAPERTVPTVTSGHSDVPVRPVGSAADAAATDGTQFVRSDLRQAARWIRKGQSFVVEVPDTVRRAEVGIGLYGRHRGINHCHDVGIWTQSLAPGQNIITAPHDGLVSVLDRSTTDSGTVVVRGGAPVPTYVAGATDRAWFDTQLTNWDRSPFFLLIGEHVQADVLRADTEDPQGDQNEQLIAGDDLDTRIGRWDEMIDVNHEVWGVQDTGHRVHIATPSFGEPGGEYIDNHQGWLAFPTDHAKPHHLLDGEDSMVGDRHLRRAFGRVFQQDVVRWTDHHGQVDSRSSEDLASLVVEERRNHRNWLDSWRRNVEEFREQPVEQRDFWNGSLNPTTRHLAFDQLRRAYGDDFIARVAERTRGPVLPGARREARLDFILAAAHVAGHDLTPFFEQWGIPVEADLRPHLAEYPALETPIWDDFDALH
ncbi:MULTISPECIES: M60 family metallopeptidase [unclassified Curtobacterium]|uniref:M60 family metallopeptidase n=1 Tax=unclassified Curtobacterium TaxID=257496 RepID=UPI0015E893FE|nr:MULTISPECIES: M60 family metallopeptidase [unclassified Curtobacterium]WIB36712.1 M60 family metallopeptidase [Curtobacterium sp. MCJR17_043]